MMVPPPDRFTELGDQLATGRSDRPLRTTAQPFQNLLVHPPSADLYGADHLGDCASQPRRCLAQCFLGKGESLFWRFSFFRITLAKPTHRHDHNVMDSRRVTHVPAFLPGQHSYDLKLESIPSFWANYHLS